MTSQTRLVEIARLALQASHLLEESATDSQLSPTERTMMELKYGSYLVRIKALLEKVLEC